MMYNAFWHMHGMVVITMYGLSLLAVFCHCNKTPQVIKLWRKS